jgi:hypothetical protein
MVIKASFGSKFKEIKHIELEICAIFSSAIYLNDEQKRIYVIHDVKVGNLYFGIGVENVKKLIKVFDFKVGQKAKYENDFLEISNLRFISSEFIKSIEDETICSLEEEIDKCGKGTLYNFFKYDDNPFLANKYYVFINALKNKNDSEIAIIMPFLLGYGNGLTPDFDDYLIGLLYTFNEVDKERYSMLASSIIDNLDKTTKISQEYLLCAINNEEFEIVERVSSSKVLKSDFDTLMSFGHSSGTNIAFGILHARKMVSDYGI